MDQIRQIPTLTDLWEHEAEFMSDHQQRLYLCQYIGDVDLFYHYKKVSVTPIQRGTLQIFKILDSLHEYYGNTSKILTLDVFYEKTPGETKFKKDFKLIQINLFQLMENARLFHLGNIGKEISESFTPEDAARKYFGTSDFSKILSYAPKSVYFNKRKSLEYAANLGLIPRYTESAVTKIPLLDTHHPPMKSTFQKYWDAWNEVAAGASTDSDSQRQWDAASTDLHRGMSAAFGALSLLPSVYTKKKEIDYAQKKRMQEQEIVEKVPASERHKLLTKGALSTQLMQRLVQDSSVHPIAGQRDKTKMFETLHNRVHSRPKPNPNGGSKKSKTRKPRKPRKSRY